MVVQQVELYLAGLDDEVEHGPGALAVGIDHAHPGLLDGAAQREVAVADIGAVDDLAVIVQVDHGAVELVVGHAARNGVLFVPAAGGHGYRNCGNTKGLCYFFHCCNVCFGLQIYTNFLDCGQ